VDIVGTGNRTEPKYRYVMTPRRCVTLVLMMMMVSMMTISWLQTVNLYDHCHYYYCCISWLQIRGRRCFITRATLARVIVIATCLSVCPSLTRRYCVKTKKASGMISSPSDSPKTLVFWHQISSPNSKGFTPNGGFKQGSVGKIQRFLALSFNISKTVADTAKVTISH